MKKQEIEEKCTDLVMPIIEAGGYDLWDVEYVKEGADYYLRVYADKEGGIGIDDCVDISRQLEKKLDEIDMIKEAYILEVSSPGLTRTLKKDKEFSKSIGKLVDIKLYKAVNGQKEIQGELAGFDEKNLTVTISGETLTLERENISIVKLAFVE
ncbi:ribosome maturation factor RimP [Eubacterium ruminantium]|nr:ribosome maturation factor RimP [Eubacterium ruminantium]